MKNLIALIFICSSILVKAQDGINYGNVPSTEVKLYHAGTDKQSNLETNGAIKKQKKKLGGFGGISFTYEMEGEKSTVRLNADSVIFIVQPGTGMMAMDISMSIALYKLEVRGGKRIAVQGDYKPSIMGVGKTTDTRVALSSKQLKEGLTQLLPKSKLANGEYAFISGMMEGNHYDGKSTKYIVYAFSIE